MPLDTVYLDIPYMDKYRDFTVDTTNFKDIPGLADTLHKQNRKLVVIIDGGLALAEDITTDAIYK